MQIIIIICTRSDGKKHFKQNIEENLLLHSLYQLILYVIITEKSNGW